MSPQIRCPNCGTTINSENRRKIDFDLILTAVKKKPRSFTELLKITTLPRKTLAIRLKELINVNAVTKDKLYYFNQNEAPEIACTLQKNSFIYNKKILFALALLFIVIPTSMHVYAMLTSPPPRQVKGFFKATLRVYNVENLIAWEAVIRYDSNNTQIIYATPIWLGTEFPFFVNATIPEFDLFLLGNLIFGNASAKTGSGDLATIIFAYYTEDYKLPELLFDFKWYPTKLYTYNRQVISLESTTLSLETEQLQ
jgi:hypothetical protein